MNVELWSVAFDAPREEVLRLSAFLSQDEQQRARRYPSEALAKRFVVARGALRELLAAHAECLPSALVFGYGRSGKPFLCARPIVFNVAHSARLAVIAISRSPHLAIGIDVEEVRPRPDLMDTARRFFARAECEELEAMDPSLRPEAFFNCWTRKEAYLKAMGDGLVTPPDRFEVTLRPGEHAAFRHIGGDPGAASSWRIHHFTPAGHIAALAVRGDAAVQPCREYRPASTIAAACEEMPRLSLTRAAT